MAAMVAIGSVASLLAASGKPLENEKVAIFLLKEEIYPKQLFSSKIRKNKKKELIVQYRLFRITVSNYFHHLADQPVPLINILQCFYLFQNFLQFGLVRDSERFIQFIQFS